MTEPRDLPADAVDNDEIDDPGRDPRGLEPPRNLFGGGSDQDGGQGSSVGDADGTGLADEPGNAAAETAEEDDGDS